MNLLKLPFLTFDHQEVVATEISISDLCHVKLFFIKFDGKFWIQIANENEKSWDQNSKNKT